MYASIRLVPNECVESDLSGESPHPAAGRSERCEWHRIQRQKWVDRNRKAASRNQEEKPWSEYATARPDTERGTEITAEQVTRIRNAVAWFATARSPLDSYRAHDAERILLEQVTNAMDASQELLDALRPIAGPPRTDDA